MLSKLPHSLDDVDLLDGVLAHVTAVELVGLSVKAAAERVAESPSADLASRACTGRYVHNECVFAVRGAGIRSISIHPRTADEISLRPN